MTVYTFTGTNADESIDIVKLSPSVTVDPAGPTAVTNTRDIIKAGGGKDEVSSGDGDDDVNLGAGNDQFYWGGFYGVGSDTVIGGSGNDLAAFKGFGPSASLTASGSHARFTAGVNVVDMVGVERVALKGADISDNITIGNLKGTAVKGVLIDLSDVDNSAVSDGEYDSIQAAGTKGNDNISIVSNGNTLKVSGLATALKITGFGAGVEDYLYVFADNGADRLDISKVSAAFAGLALDGGNGNDVLIGSAAGNDIFGGRGADKISGGGGADFLFGGYYYGQDKSVDNLRGGGGADSFVIALPTTQASVDRILDFKPGVDKVKLLGEAFVDALGLTIEANEFTIGKKATLPTHHLIYDDQSGNLFFDANGSDPGGAMRIAVLSKGLAMTEGDFNFLLF
ncbi:MAG TPA: hypothetical protein PKA74_13565 [Bauldia sp.]|nr:hypothetical protein [Bauldia sp.]